MVSLYLVKVYGWKLGLLVDGVVVCSCDCYHSVYGAAPWWWSLTRTPAGQVQRRALLSRDSLALCHCPGTCSYSFLQYVAWSVHSALIFYGSMDARGH